MRLIDADELLQRAIPHGWSTPKWVSDIAIDDAPTIDAAPVKHGEWIVRPISNGWGACSACGMCSKYLKSWNYCPNCGAKMDGGKDDGVDS